MRTFKEDIEFDLDSFLNDREFCDEHNINGNIVICLVDEDISDERTSKNRDEGVYIIQKSLFIKKENIDKPAIESLLTLDNEDYLVTNVKEAGFLYEIILVRNDY